jgi:hypothetical protein
MSLSTFNVGGIYNGVQTGMITSYIGTTNTDPNSVLADPPGWVIANGIQRTNGSDGRYNRLIELGIGEGTLTKDAANYTPINLKASMLRGINSQTYNKGAENQQVTITYNGPTALGDKVVQKLQKHKHSYTIAEHNHNLRVKVYNNEYPLDGGGQNTNTGTQFNPKFGLFAMNGADTNNGYTNKSDWVNLDYLYAINPGYTSIQIETTDNTANIGTNIFPVNYGVHWIIKL